jgi:hypothetical protein
MYSIQWYWKVLGDIFNSVSLYTDSVGFVITEYCKSRSEPGSSVSIVSGYGLDDQAIEVQFPADAKGFFL